MFGLRSIGKRLANALSHVATKGEVAEIDNKLTGIAMQSIIPDDAAERLPKAGPNRALRRAMKRGTQGVRKRSTRNAAHHGKRGNKFTGEGCLMYPGRDTHELVNDRGFQLVENSKAFSIVAQTKRGDLTQKELAAV